MVHGSQIWLDHSTLGTLALEFGAVQSIQGKSMRSLDVYRVVALAFLGAALVGSLPGINAFLAEHRVAPAALEGVLDHVGADGADEE